MAKDTWSVIHSSKRMEWQTPPEVFEGLDNEFGFGLDAAASAANARCKRYISEIDDALAMPAGTWSKLSNGQPVWLNPPYGRAVKTWVQKAISEAAHGATVVMLVFACTDTRWFRLAWHSADEIRFLTGRVRFRHPDTGAVAGPAPKGSCVLVFRPTVPESGPKVSLVLAD